MTDLRPTIVAKSDQLNSDDLIGRAITVRVTKVSLCKEADQPIAVHFEGDNGKPYKPCKSMRRVLVHLWGDDGSAFSGRRMTLYRDDKVQFGGMAVGGIRISHMSHIDREVTMALTATRANKKPFTVRPLHPEKGDAPPQDRAATRDAPGEATQPGAGDGAPTLTQRAEAFLRRQSAATTSLKMQSVWAASAQLRDELDKADPETLTEITEAFNTHAAEIEAAERAGADDGFPGDRPA